MPECLDPLPIMKKWIGYNSSRDSIRSRTWNAISFLCIKEIFDGAVTCQARKPFPNLMNCSKGHFHFKIRSMRVWVLGKKYLSPSWFCAKWYLRTSWSWFRFLRLWRWDENWTYVLISKINQSLSSDVRTHCVSNSKVRESFTRWAPWSWSRSRTDLMATFERLLNSESASLLDIASSSAYLDLPVSSYT